MNAKPPSHRGVYMYHFIFIIYVLVLEEIEFLKVNHLYLVSGGF